MITCVACLGPLPPELVSRILLSLSPVERVRCEGVCRAWQHLLRAPEQHTRLDTRALLHICRTDGLALRAPGGACVAVAAMARRAGASLRSLAVEGDTLALAALRCLRWTRLPAVVQLRTRHVSPAPLNGLLNLTDPAASSRVDAADCQLVAASLAAAQPDENDEEDAAELRSLLTRQVACGGLQLLLDACVFEWADDAEEQDDDLADDPRAVRMLRLGQLLRLAAWPSVRVSLSASAVENVLGHDAAAAATATTLFEVCLRGLAGDDDDDAPAPPCRCCIDLRQLTELSVREVTRIAQAAPPHARLLLGCVQCTEDDVAQLPRALRAGVVAAATLRFDATMPPAALGRILATLGACADAQQQLHDAAEAGNGFALWIDNGGHGCMLQANILVLRAWLADTGAALLELMLPLGDAAHLAALAPVLGAQLRVLHVDGGGAVGGASLAAFAHALEAGQLPALRSLHLGALNDALLDALTPTLRLRTAPFQLSALPAATPAEHVRLLSRLLRTAHVRSGVPLAAAAKLSALIDQTCIQLDASATVALTAACAAFVQPHAASLVPPLFAIIALHCGEGAEEQAADEEEEENEKVVDASERVCKPAELLLRLMQLAPAAVRPLLCTAAHVALLARCVRRAHWHAPSASLKITPLLHRCLLEWARIGATPEAHVLASIVSACRRELPEAGYATVLAVESRIAILTMLLACSLTVPDAAARAEPALDAAAGWLASHAAWLFDAVADVISIAQMRAAGPAARHLLHHSVYDATLQLAAAARMVPVAAAFFDAHNFGPLMRTLLASRWVPLSAAGGTLEDWAPAAAAAYAALSSILARMRPIAVRLLVAGWSAADEDAGTAVQQRVNVVALLADSIGRMQAVISDDAAACAAVSAAHVHAAAALRCLQAVVLHSAEHLMALAAAQHSEGVNHALSSTEQLRRGLLCWARDGRGADATPHALCVIATACRAALPKDEDTSAHAANARTRVCCAMLACGLAGATANDEPDMLWMRAWLASHAEFVFASIGSMLAAAQAPFRGEEPTLLAAAGGNGACDAAMHLSAAVRVAPLVAAFFAARRFAPIMTGLLRGCWMPVNGGHAPERDAITAAAAFGALSALLMRAPSAARLELSNHWTELADSPLEPFSLSAHLVQDQQRTRRLSHGAASASAIADLHDVMCALVTLLPLQRRAHVAEEFWRRTT